MNLLNKIATILFLTVLSNICKSQGVSENFYISYDYDQIQMSIKNTDRVHDFKGQKIEIRIYTFKKQIGFFLNNKDIGGFTYTSYEYDEVTKTCICKDDNRVYVFSLYYGEVFEKSNNNNNRTIYKFSKTEKNDQNKTSFVVTVRKTFFYDTPSYESRRNSYLLLGDIGTVLQTKDSFLYVAYMNTNLAVTTGWISKYDIRITN